MPSSRERTPRKLPRQQRSQATVTAILEATAQVLVKHGYERTTTGRIAELAGVSIGTLYQYFPNKEAVVCELLSVHLGAVLTRMEAAVQAAPTRRFSHQLRAALDALVRAKAANPKLHRVISTELGRLDGLRLMRQMNAASLRFTHDLLQTHRDELRLRDPERAAFFVVNAVEGVLDAILVESPQELARADLAGELHDLVLAYLRQDRARLPTAR